jgi:hypothetical protein
LRFLSFWATGGNIAGGYTFRPLVSADLQQAATLSGLPVERLAAAAYDSAVAAELRAGVLPERVQTWANEGRRLGRSPLTG